MALTSTSRAAASAIHQFSVRYRRRDGEKEDQILPERPVSAPVSEEILSNHSNEIISEEGLDLAGGERVECKKSRDQSSINVQGALSNNSSDGEFYSPSSSPSSVDDISNRSSSSLKSISSTNSVQVTSRGREIKIPSKLKDYKISKCGR